MKKWLLAGAVLAMGCPNSCVARGTRVRTPSGTRFVEDLEVGDEVFAVNEQTGELVPTIVTATKCATREVGLLRFDDAMLRLTSDHPVYCPVDEVYAPAGDWFLGKRTSLLRVGEDGARNVVAPDEVESFVQIADVFDITVESDLHNFVAEGFVVHNKDIANSEPGYDCIIEGVEYRHREACPCANSAVGEADCFDEVACTLCGEANNTTDMSVADSGTMDVGNADAAGNSDLGPDLGTDLGTDAGMVRQRGDCVTDDDCAMDTWMCVAVGEDEPGAHYTCQADVVAEPGCATIEAPDECCLHTDCTDDPSGKCVIGPIFYCGGVAPMIANVCMYDECASAADCDAGELCMPPRALGEPVSRCVDAECGTDADCDDRAGGECHMFRNPCNGRVSGFFCTYDDSECRTGDDCPEDPNTPGVDYCAPGPDGNGDTFCASFVPPP